MHIRKPQKLCSVLQCILYSKSTLVLAGSIELQTKVSPVLPEIPIA